MNGRKYIYILLVVLVFFAVQIGIFWYAGFLFKKTVCTASATGENSSVNYNFLYRIDQRISQLQSEMNYLRGYILSKEK